MEDKEEKENNTNPFENSGDEDYGLPKVSYDPVNREHTREPINMNPKEQTSATPKKNTYKEDSSWPLIVGIAVIIILAGALIYFFVIKTPEETVEPIVETPPVEEEVVIPDAEEFESSAENTDWDTPEEPVEPETGSISMISNRTGKAFIVAGSFIDVDLARDYGNKLASEGVSTTIIEPYGKVKYYRLAIAEYPTIGDAINNLEEQKTKYGDNIWVLKY